MALGAQKSTCVRAIRFPSPFISRLQTTLATMSVTLNGLKLPLTVYQLYAWATTSDEATDEILQKTFCLGLTVLAAPSKWTAESHQQLESHILSHIQTVSLQWARLYVNQPGGLSTFNPMLATAWAAQAALWQLQWLPEDPKRSMILPRLAESMAQKLLQYEEESKSQSAEVQTLALRTLRQQSKWEEMLEILGKQLSSGSEDQPPSAVEMTDFGVSMTGQQVMTQKALVLCELERYEEAKAVYEELIARSPDDWSCWKGHLQCCSKLDNTLLAKELLDKVLSERASEKYPLRAIHLMKVELEADKLRGNPSGDSLAALSSSIQEYSQLFASRAVCAFSDLEAFIELTLSTKIDTSKQVIEDLLQFAQTLRSSNASAQGGDSYSNKERQSRLRAYIFGVKLNHKILADYVDLQAQWLPEWTELVTEWKSTLAMDSSTEGEEVSCDFVPRMLYFIECACPPYFRI
jgi:tetratricopeptide (TPR) repeat protein